MNSSDQFTPSPFECSSGMLGVTLFGIFLTPVFFYVIQWFGRDKPAQPARAPAPVANAPVVTPAQATGIQETPGGIGAASPRSEVEDRSDKP